MLKNSLIILSLGAVLFACTSSPYHMSSYERQGEKGYHARVANEVIDKNEKNKALNQKAAEKNRVATNERLNTLNASKKKTEKIHKTTFTFY